MSEQEVFQEEWGSESHIGKEWDSDEESSFDNEGVATLAIKVIYVPESRPQVPHG